jgi:NAD(P)-dependent dehydrogenase (short-subunit alcohol dehydrogenase family)
MSHAGVFPDKKVLSHDGFELTWAVNMLAPFLLTNLLLDAVKERIVNVSSISAGSSIDFDNLNQVASLYPRQPELDQMHSASSVRQEAVPNSISSVLAHKHISQQHGACRTELYL